MAYGLMLMGVVYGCDALLHLAGMGLAILNHSGRINPYLQAPVYHAVYILCLLTDLVGGSIAVRGGRLLRDLDSRCFRWIRWGMIILIGAKLGAFAQVLVQPWMIRGMNMRGTRSISFLWTPLIRRMMQCFVDALLPWLFLYVAARPEVRGFVDGREGSDGNSLGHAHE